MIKVPFTLDLIYKETPEWFLENTDYMPWLTYLKENCEHLEIKRCGRNEATLQENVIYEFHLEPKKETYYRLKYGD